MAPAGTRRESVTGDPSWKHLCWLHFSSWRLVPRRQGVSQPWSCCTGQAHWGRAGPEVEGAPSMKLGGPPGRSSGEVWQQALGGKLGGLVVGGRACKGCWCHPCCTAGLKKDDPTDKVSHFLTSSLTKGVPWASHGYRFRLGTIKAVAQFSPWLGT